MLLCTIMVHRKYCKIYEYATEMSSGELIISKGKGQSGYCWIFTVAARIPIQLGQMTKSKDRSEIFPRYVA
jgi:hypothetical protein